MTDAKWLTGIAKKYNGYFKTNDPKCRSLHDLLWQIVIKEMLKDEKEPVLFHNIISEYENELVLAYSSGGYKSTGVYFINQNYNSSVDLTEKLNEDFFQIDKKEQMELISKSMFTNT